MGNENFKNNKPSHPAPPLNALKNPEVNIPEQHEKPPKKEPAPFRSVYDEIAERRKKEKHKIGVTSSEEREDIQFSRGDIAGKPVINQQSDDDVKVYTPEKHRDSEEILSGSEPEPEPEFELNTEGTTDIYIDDSPRGEEVSDEENFDVPSLPKPKRKLGPWVAIISALSAMCVIAAGAYGAVNGYFDGLIKMF